MTATNHGLSGYLMGAVLPLPLAIPAAFLSHFILDKIPHYGVDNNQKNSSRVYKLIVFGDVILALCLLAAGIFLQKWTMVLVGLVAYSPDISFVLYYFRHNRDLNILPKNSFMKFHLAIQYERPWGIIPEIAIAIVLAPFVAYYLLN